MNLRKNISETELKSLMELYEQAFPPEERRPADKMPPADSAFTFYAVGDCGLLTTWNFGSFTYVEHFAIYPEKRGNGIGAKALQQLQGTVVLEVEPPESGDMARRRVDFYVRNGFRMLDFDYIQPPYAPGLSPVKLRLMVRGELSCSAGEVERTLHERVYGCCSAR